TANAPEKRQEVESPRWRILQYNFLRTAHRPINLLRQPSGLTATGMQGVSDPLMELNPFHPQSSHRPI
ncbi:hypothetical protein Ancab_001611, partial [Ancistrocladus abbreviatus]